MPEVRPPQNPGKLPMKMPFLPSRWSWRVALGAAAMAAAAILIESGGAGSLLSLLSAGSSRGLESVLAGLAGGPRHDGPLVSTAAADEGDRDEAAAEEPAAGGLGVAGSSGADVTAIEEGIFLPTDRLRERQLERAGQAIERGSYSDAATMIDDILSGEADSFSQIDGRGSTWSSVKAQALNMLGRMPAAGRDAYELQFRARAERALEAAVVADDRDAIVAVARRWFYTPAGAEAALLSAIDALASGQPLSAAAWTARLANSGLGERFEPTLSLMRAVAAREAGDPEGAGAALTEALRRVSQPGREGPNELRIAGRRIDPALPRDAQLAMLGSSAAGPETAGSDGGSSDDAWRLAGGSPSRSTVLVASRPLMVPRFRVPLTRHPGEASLLARQRRTARDRDRPLVPAGQSLVVADTIVVRSPLGVLGIDFQTGKRTWLQSGPFEADDAALGAGEDGETASDSSALARGYEDLTGGSLSSDGRLVFAVESPPAAAASLQQQGLVRPFGMGMDGFGNNVLSAYDALEQGRLVWRLPRADGEDGRVGDAAVAVRRGRFAVDPDQRRDAGSPWFLGPPLPVGKELYALVEERGEIRLDMIDARSGSVLWSQPIAELDEDRRIEQPGSRLRRLAGLSPSLDEGIVVCPTAAGAVIGVDIATRTLVWAYRYATQPMADIVRLPNGMIIRRNARGALTEVTGDEEQRWIESTPVLSGGKVFLTPVESDELHCLDLRTGSLLWKAPRADGLVIAGADRERVVVVGRQAVVALAAGDGRELWSGRFSSAGSGGGSMPCGRGLITKDRLLLPVDTPALLEIDLRDGRLLSESPRRSGLPGNLVASRGEVISQAIDSVDVFYQELDLQRRLQSAGDSLAGALPAFWKGQLLLDAGKVRAGVEAIAAAGREDPRRVTPGMVAEAMLEGMRLDFAATAELFPESLRQCPDDAVAREMLRAGIDGFLALSRPQDAWDLWQQAARRCLSDGPSAESDDLAAGLVSDGDDPQLVSTLPRWLGGRLEAVLAADRQGVDAAVARFVEEVRGMAVDRGPAGLAMLADLVAAHPLAGDVRREREARLMASLEDPGAVSAAGLRDRLLELELARMLDPGAATRSPQNDGNQAAVWERPLSDAWPVGRVVTKSPSAAAGRRADIPAIASLPILSQAGLPSPEGLRLTLDRRQPGMIVQDGFGRELGGQLSFEGSAQTRRLGIQAVVLPGAAIQPSIVGRLLLVTSATGTAAFELSLPDRFKQPRRAEEPGLQQSAAAVPQVAGMPEHRRLWHVSHASQPRTLTVQAPGMPGRGGRLPHLGGGIRLGTTVTEARPMGADAPPPSMLAALVGPAAAPVLEQRSLSMRDPVTGRVFWTRSMLPPGCEILTDTTSVCVIPAEGQGAAVYSIHDGRLVARCDLPSIDQWLATSGRRVLAIDRGQGGGFGVAARVELVLIDPLDGHERRFGPFAAEAHAAVAGPGKVAVLEPDGRLTVIDIEAESQEFSVLLDRMPPDLNQFYCQPWEDRLLVIASRPETAAENEQHRQLGAITGIRTGGLWDSGPQIAPLVTGAVWAVDRHNGESLWTVPATLLRHGFDPDQPADLPVLVFARRIKTQGSARQPQLSLLCLDKRTGHEVFLDDRIETEQHLFYGCEIAGDPENHTIILSHGAREITLTFTGEAISPRPPYQGLTRPVEPPSLSDKIESWLEQAFEALPF